MASSRTEPSQDPEFADLEAARAAIERCTRCPLYANATQAVFGEGPPDADVMLVGEQPGDREDRDGRPFVGPAGRLLDDVLVEAGLERDTVFLTNAVKHFKFLPRGKRRLHQKPNAAEISACAVWLHAERALVRPGVIVALGATAARSLIGRVETIAKLRGVPQRLADGTMLFITVHPSYILRIPDRARAATERTAFTRDLVAVRTFIERASNSDRSA